MVCTSRCNAAVVQHILAAIFIGAVLYDVGVRAVTIDVVWTIVCRRWLLLMLLVLWLLLLLLF